MLCLNRFFPQITQGVNTMQKLTYLAIFKALDSDDGYEACFPDLPNFVIMGATMAETLKKTKASLERCV